MKITEALIAEHTAFSGVFGHIERMLPSLNTLAEVRSLANLVERMLRGHADSEVNLAYAALDQMLEHKGRLDRLNQEHDEIDARIERACEARTLPEARRLLTGVLAASRDHFKREEQSLFPLIEEHLQPGTLCELGEAWMEHRRPLDQTVACQVSKGTAAPRHSARADQAPSPSA